MKSLSKMFAALLVAGTAFTAMPAMTGCYGASGALVVTDMPPPPRAEVVVSRPGYTWINGHWTFVGGHWLWQAGYYVRERPNAVYVEGRWERRGRGNVWVEGGWRPRGNVTVRDRR
jgi:YXWGXW repeat-containing protein